MKEMIVYHGATQKVDHPICKVGRPNLDFGQGFYVTDMIDQAVDWAKRQARNRKELPLLNRYRLNREGYLEEGRTLIFDSYNEEWLKFIVASRSEQKPWIDFDFIEGGIANDRVVDTVNLYMQGFITIETALARLSQHQPNNQICLLNQKLTDKYLIFDGTEDIK